MAKPRSLLFPLQQTAKAGGARGLGRPPKSLLYGSDGDKDMGLAILSIQGVSQQVKKGAFKTRTVLWHKLDNLAARMANARAVRGIG